MNVDGREGEDTRNTGGAGRSGAAEGNGADAAGAAGAAGANSENAPAGQILDRVDALLALVLIAGCGYFYWVSSNLPVPGLFLGDNVLPEQFPRLLLAGIGLFALLLPFEHKVEIERWPLIRKSRSAPIGLDTVKTMAFLLVLVGAGESLGTILTVFLAAAGLPLLWGERRWILILVYSVAFTAITTYLFSIVLSVYFEPGIFGLTLR